MQLSNSRRGLFALLVLAAACAEESSAPAPAPRIELLPQQVAFSCGSSDQFVAVRAQVRGFGRAPTFRWISLSPEAVASHEVSDGGAAVVLRGVVPCRAAGVELRVTGTATLADTLPVSAY